MAYREQKWFIVLFLVTSFVLTAIGCADSKPERGTQIKAYRSGPSGGGPGRRGGKKAHDKFAGGQNWQILANPKKISFEEMTSQFDIVMMKDSPAVKLEELQAGNYVTEHVYILWKKDGDGGFAALFDLNIESNRMNGTYYFTNGKGVAPSIPPFLLLTGLTVSQQGLAKDSIRQLGFLFRIASKADDNSSAEIIFPAGRAQADDAYRAALETAPNASNMYGSTDKKNKITGLFIRKDGERARVSLDYNSPSDGTFLFVFVLKPSATPATAEPPAAAADPVGPASKPDVKTDEE